MNSGIIPVKFKTFFLLFAILNAGAWALATPDVTDHVEDLGMGTKTMWSAAPYARNPWDMQTYRGKLYIGSGNSANSGPSINAGPVPIISFDPLTGQFTHTGAGLYEAEGTIGTEQIDLFRVLEDGKLYIPSHDPVGTCNENYIMDQDGWVSGPGVAQSIHVYDLALHEGRFYAAQGASPPPVRDSEDLINWYQRSLVGTLYDNRLYAILQAHDQLFVMSASYYAAFQNGVFEYRSESESFYKREDLTIPNMFPDPPSDMFAARAIRPKRLGSSAVYLGGSGWNDHQFLPRGGVWVADSLVEDALDVRRVSFPDGVDTFDTWDETDNPEGGDVWDMIVKEDRIYAVSSTPGLKTGSAWTDPASPRLIQVWESTDRTTFTERFRFTASTFVRSMEILNGDFYFGLGCEISNLYNWDPNELHPDTGKILRVKAEHTGWAVKPEVFVDSDGDAYFHDQTASRFILRRTGCTQEPITVGYTLAGTAVPGVDYQALPGEVTISAGETSAEVIIQPLADAPQEGDRRAVLTLSAGESYRRTDPVTASVRILRTVVVTIMAGADAHEDGEVPGHFIVQRSQARPTALELRFSTSGSARSGTDYVEDLGTRVTIPAGESQTTMTITPIDNDVIGDKTLTLSLWRLSSYWRQYTKDRATIRIHDNDYNRVLPPAFDPDGGEHLGDSVDVTVTCATEGATIRYTTDGTDPTEESPTVASGGSVSLPISGTLKAKTWKDGMYSSRVTSADYSEASDAGDHMVIDVSGGPSASEYPVSYTNAVPADGWADEYKTTRIVLRRIPTGTFTTGSPADELGRSADREAQRLVTLTEDFYIGVFQVTQKQWERVMGDWPSRYANETYRDSRPVEQVSSFQIRENPNNSAISPNWPASSQVHADSFTGRLRARTGLTMLDLPTEAQWEYACRALTTSALNSWNNLTSTGECPNMSEVGRYQHNHPGGYSTDQEASTDSGTAKVGTYLANQWGLYDMHGNVAEWCLDWYVADLGTNPVTDPEGASSGTQRVRRGGGMNQVASGCRSAFRESARPDTRGATGGFRLALTLRQSHTLTVIGGTGGGDHAEGAAGAVTADEPPVGQVFVRWTVDPSETDLGASFDETQSSTTLTMPAHAVTLTASYLIVRAALGTPYYWLIQHGLASEGDSAAAFDAAELSDPQGKGQPAYHDYIAGLDPNDPGSFFRMAAPGADPAGEFTLNWHGVDGRLYRIYRSTSLTLTPADWQMIDTVIATADGAMSYVDADPALADGRTFFYCIRVLMAE